MRKILFFQIITSILFCMTASVIFSQQKGFNRYREDEYVSGNSVEICL